MRILYLLRHAKSSWSDAGLDDHDRPLNERGIHDAPRMAEHFRTRNEKVDLIVSSTAARALATAQVFRHVLSLPESALITVPRLYLATPSALLSQLNAVPDPVGSVMFVGHNPGISEFAEQLSGRPLGDLPTAALVRIDLPFESWALASRGTGDLVWQDHPKMHPGHFGSV